MGWAIVCGLLLLAVGYLIAVPLGVVARENRLGTPEIVLGVALMAAVAFAVQTSYSLTTLSVGSAGFSADFVRRIEERTVELESAVSELSDEVSELFLHTMAPSMFENLAKLTASGFDYVLSDGLGRELLHLRDIGYIENFALERIPDSGPDLTAYITITAAGRRFVELREAADDRHHGAGAGDTRSQMG
jgi:hypothetical protein